MPSVLDVILMTRKLLHPLKIITISDANYVGTNGLKAASKYGKRRQSIALVREHVTFRQPSDCSLE